MPDQGTLSLSPITVAVDAMGGDFGPSETVPGALQALRSHNIKLALVGDTDRIKAELARVGAPRTRCASCHLTV